MMISMKFGGAPKICTGQDFGILKRELELAVDGKRCLLITTDPNTAYNKHAAMKHLYFHQHISWDVLKTMKRAPIQVMELPIRPFNNEKLLEDELWTLSKLKPEIDRYYKEIGIKSKITEKGYEYSGKRDTLYRSVEDRIDLVEKQFFALEMKELSVENKLFNINATGGEAYNLSTHLVLIDDTTALSKEVPILNPKAWRIKSDIEVNAFINTCWELNPRNEKGNLSLIFPVEEEPYLEKLVRAAKEEKLNLNWLISPMPCTDKFEQMKPTPDTDEYEQMKKDFFEKEELLGSYVQFLMKAGIEIGGLYLPIGGRLPTGFSTFLCLKLIDRLNAKISGFEGPGLT